MPRILHANASLRTRLFFTRFVFAIWLFRYLVYPIEHLAELPREYYSPVGVLYWIPIWMADSLLDWQILFVARMVLIASCAAALSPSLFRITAPLACVLITLEQSFLRSFSSHMNHAEVNLLFAVYLTTAFAFADEALHRKRRPTGRAGFSVEGIPLFAIALFFCMTYYFVGVSRLTYGGLTILQDDTIIKTTLMHTRQPWHLNFDLGEWLVESEVVRVSMKAGFGVITILEVLAPLCLVWPFYRRLFVAGMLGFHVAIILAMKIAFWENMLLLLVLTDLENLLPSRAAAAESCASKNVGEVNAI